MEIETQFKIKIPPWIGEVSVVLRNGIHEKMGPGTFMADDGHFFLIAVIKYA